MGLVRGSSYGREMAKVFDSHRHFTGALPAWFICSEARRRIEEPEAGRAIRTLFQHRDITPNALRRAFRSYMIQEEPAYLSFFELYRLIQDITKPGPGDHDAFYFRAGEAIGRQLRSEEADTRLIVGAHPDKDLLARRLVYTLAGAASSSPPAPSIRLRLAFIRSAEGTFTNLSPTIIESIFDLVHSDDGMLSACVDGFDFCGLEFGSLGEPVLEALDTIADLNSYSTARGRKPLKACVHAGESVFRSTISASLNSLLELCDRQRCPDRIAHGTILWIPRNCVALDQGHVSQRTECLRILAKRRIALEICPTANVRMTPLGCPEEIPFLELGSRGIEVKIGTDNPSILDTTIGREMRYSQTAERRECRTNSCTNHR